MKKLFSIFLLTAFVFNLCGYLVIFKAIQFNIRREIKATLKKKLPEKDLHIICFSLKQIKDIDWEENDREFRYNGIMYDVVKWKKANDYIIYYCINDDQETCLFAQLEELTSKQLEDDNSSAGQTAKNLFKVFSAVEYISTKHFSIITPNISETESFTYFVYCFPVVMEILTPPPNRVV